MRALNISTTSDFNGTYRVHYLWGSDNYEALLRQLLTSLGRDKPDYTTGFGFVFTTLTDAEIETLLAKGEPRVNMGAVSAAIASFQPYQPGDIVRFTRDIDNRDGWQTLQVLDNVPLAQAGEIGMVMEVDVYLQTYVIRPASGSGDPARTRQVGIHFARAEACLERLEDPDGFDEAWLAMDYDSARALWDSRVGYSPAMLQILHQIRELMLERKTLVGKHMADEQVSQEIITSMQRILELDQHLRRLQAVLFTQALYDFDQHVNRLAKEGSYDAGVE